MNIEPDYAALRRLMQERGPARPRPAWQWILIIAAGTLLANAVSAGVLAAYVAWETQKLAIEAQHAADRLERQTQQLRERGEATRAAQLAQQRALNAEQQRLRQQKDAAIRQATETCTYWQQQLRKQASQYHRAMQDSACRRVRTLR